MTLKSSPRPSRQLLSRRGWMWVLVGVALSAAAIFAASRWLEVVDETEWVGVKGEAATNPYLALERLLAAKGATIRIAAKSDELDQQLKQEDVRVLMLGANRVPSMTPERVASIAAWVQQGGHLIVEAERPGLGDPLLSGWSMTRKPLVWRGRKFVEADDSPSAAPSPKHTTDSADADVDAAELQPAPDYTVKPRNEGRNRPMPLTPGQYVLPQAQATQITLADGTTFKAIFYPFQNLAETNATTSTGSAAKPRDPISISRDRLGGRIAELGVGQGRVTAISNFDFVQWKELGKADHAELIWHLLTAKQFQRQPTVLLMLRPTTLGVGSWLLENAWMVLLTLVGLLGCWIWQVLPRFGPLLPPLAAPRRSLREHIRAAGGWLASRSDWMSLVAPVRAQFGARLAQRHPRSALMSQYDRLEYAARLCGLTLAETSRLLTSNVDSRRECLYVIKWLMLITARLDGETGLRPAGHP